MNSLATFSAAASNGGAHILVFPFPAQGHMLPLLDLTHQLALQSLTITILTTPKNLPILTPLLSTHPSIQTLILPFPATPSIPPDIENTQHLSGSFAAVIAAMSQLHSPLLHWFQSHPSPPTAILSDMFLGWTHHLARQLGIPRIVFSPSGALTLSLYAVLWRDVPVRVYPNEPVRFEEVPNCPSYPWWQISPLFRSYAKGGPFSEFLREGMLANFESWGIVFNSFNQLENVYLDHLRKVMGHSRVWAVGPLAALSINPTLGLTSDNKILAWLDTCIENSVIYVCFGSQAVMKNKQMKELALGLENSGVRFIWCIKEPTVEHASGEYGLIPDGFEDRVGTRGLVVKEWVPQALILKHRAVGLFFTHCGWNSVLEALVAGVPMLTWPMTADQFANATLLVDQFGVAVRVCEGEETVPNADELARVVTKSVSLKGFENERIKAKELSNACFNSIKEGGSSFKDLYEIVEELTRKNLIN